MLHAKRTFVFSVHLMLFGAGHARNLAVYLSADTPRCWQDAQNALM